MKITVSKEFLAKTVSDSIWKALGVTDRQVSYREQLELNLDNVSTETGQALLDLALKHPKLPKVRGLTSDLRVWVKAAAGETGTVPRNVKQFETIVREMIRRTPGHRVFKKTDDGWWCYYVSSTEFHPASGSGDRRTSPRCTINLRCLEFGGMKEDRVSFHPRDCLGIAPKEALRNSDLYLETPELREAYLKTLAHFDSFNGKLGLQCHASGYAEVMTGESWRWQDVRMDREDGPARVVIDVFEEGDKKKEQKTLSLAGDFWATAVERKRETEPDDDDADEEDELSLPEPDEDDDEEDEEAAPRLPKAKGVEIPWHPYLAVFDLGKHRRVKIHADNLVIYPYDTKLGDKLVLPGDIQAFIKLLTSYSGTFTDIIAGKGSGIACLLAGPPGAGKTLTAQVYSEVLKKPLYSVQASQLGLSAAKLEEELLKVFARSQRWNAILLIDEADVYVRTRGNDLQQNAIVGVFLRVMEYYDGILFMTTNRADLVDDAIASRCVARIEFRPPEVDGQKRLWRVLSEVMGLTITDATIAALVKAHPKLSGRDIKNLLKLAQLTCPDISVPVSVDTINFVKKFKPTESVSEDRNGK